MSEPYLGRVVPARAGTLAYRSLNGQMSIVDLRRGTLNTLNETATRVWELLGQEMSVNDIAITMSREFEATIEQVTVDLLETLEEMASLGWIDDFPSVDRSHSQADSDGSQVFEALREQAVKERVPLTAHFDLTYRCNLRCVHCYLSGGEKQAECTTEEVKDILDQLANAGTLYLTFSGGEVFLRRDLPEIMEHARRLHFAVRLLTTGTLIDDSMVDTIAKWHPEMVAFSVYHLDPAIHDTITGKPGSLKKTLKIIRALAERQVPIKIASVLMQSNVDGYRQVYQFAKEVGAQFQVDYRIMPKINGSQEPLKYHITDKQVLEALGDQIFSREYEAEPDLSQGYSGVFTQIPCGAGHMSCYITPYGMVTPCVQVSMECGSLRKRSFTEIWENSPELEAFRSIRFSDMVGCSNCELLPYCRPCPGLNLVETGNLLTPPLRVCKEAMYMKNLNKRRR